MVCGKMMRHWSLEADVSETGHLYWPLTHHLRAPGPGATVCSLCTTLMLSPWCLSVTRGTQLSQLIGVHILLNRGTRCQLGGWITHQNLHPVLHSLEEGVLPAHHQCLNIWRCSQCRWSGHKGHDVRLGWCRRRGRCWGRRCRRYRNLKSRSQAWLGLGVSRSRWSWRRCGTWQGKNPAKRGGVGRWCLIGQTRCQLLRMRSRRPAHWAEEGVWSSSSVWKRRNRLIQMHVEVRNGGTLSGPWPSRRRRHITASRKKHAQAWCRTRGPWGLDWSLVGQEWSRKGCRKRH